MSVRRRLVSLLPGAFLMGCCVALAADEVIPDAAFLEYLGMWEQSDDEWLALEDEGGGPDADTDERIDPAPGGEESTEERR